MKFNTILISIVLSLFFVGIEISASDAKNINSINYELSIDNSEPVEEIEDNRFFTHPNIQQSYLPNDSNMIIYESSFFLRDNFKDIQKPPIRY